MITLDLKQKTKDFNTCIILLVILNKRISVPMTIHSSMIIIIYGIKLLACVEMFVFILILM